MDGSNVLPNFKDFDKADVCKAGESYILQPDALNFALEFDSDQALLGLGLGATSVQDLLQAEKVSAKSRWICLWCPEQQKDIVMALGAHYGFSPRLRGFMCQDPEKPVIATMDNHQSHYRNKLPGLRRWKSERASFESQSPDLEMTSTFEQPASHAMDLDLNHYRMVDQVWYYCSVDWGSKCKNISRLQNRQLMNHRSLCGLQFIIAA